MFLYSLVPRNVKKNIEIDSYVMNKYAIYYNEI